MAFLLRVSLPDRPGSLGQLASALGTVGADIEAIEVVERRLDGTAVDDVLVGLPAGALPDSLVSACRSVPGVAVDWISRFAAGGGLFPDLEAVEVMTQEPSSAAARLVDVLPTVFRADWAALVCLPDGAPGRQGPLDVRHASSAAPDLDGLPLARPVTAGARRVAVPPAWEGLVGADLVLALATVPAGWTVPGSDHAAGSDHAGPDHAASDHAVGHACGRPVPADAAEPGEALLALGRRGGPEFLDSELARLFHLSSLAASITGAARDGSPVT